MYTLCNSLLGRSSRLPDRQAQEAGARVWAGRCAGGLWLWAVALLLCLGAAGAARAAAPSWQIEHCTDPAVRQLSQALSCPWQAEPPPRRGWGQDSRWLRVRVGAVSEPSGQALVLQLRPHFLERVELHQQDLQGQWQQRSAGSQLPGSQPFAVLGGYEFPLQPRPAEQFVYLQVRAQNVQAMGITLQTRWQADQAVRGLGRVDIGLQLGLLAMVALFSVISFALHPQKVMGRFALSSVNMLAGMASGSGLLALTWLQNHPGLDMALFDSLVCLRLALWIWVAQALLEAYTPPAWFGKACTALYAGVALALALNLLGFRAATYGLMLPVLLLTPGVLAWGAWRTQAVPAAFRRILVGGFVFSGALILLVVGLALLPPWAFEAARYGAWLTDFVNPAVMLMLVVLQRRSQLAQLQGVQDELMRARLQSDFERRLLAERQLLIDMLVHELKNPLAAIRLALASLFPSAQLADAGGTRRLQNIRRSIADMSHVLERCALMNALEQADVQRSPVDLATLLHEAVQASDEPQRFALQLATATVHSDPQLLRLVVSNLLENALKYSPEGSRIEVVLEPGTAVRVANVVAPEMQPDPEKLFTRYYRHPLAQQVRGTGLGLFLVREICQKMGARIGFEGSAGRVLFTLELPA